MALTIRRAPRIERGLLVLGGLLRFYLALVNDQANDDHLSVIRIIAAQHRLPRLRDAWEGFQPKLYHLSVAVLWDLSPWQSPAVRVRIAQLVACAAGLATLFVLRRAMARWSIAPGVRLLAFALVALNPTLIGLNAQATNDSFVILFSTLALAEGAEFFRTGARRAFLVMTASVVLATLSKGNGLVVFGAILGTLLVAMIRESPVPRLARRRLLGLTAGFSAFFLVVVAALGSYRPNWEDTGSPFAINGERAPAPHWFQPTYVYRPGVTSIVDAYFTFRLVDLVEHPMITNDAAASPRHRTSLWSQLYGRAHFAHFAQHPPSWQNTSPLALTVGRLILMLGLLPTALLLAGLTRGVAALLRAGLPAVPEVPLDRVLLAFAAVGFVVFIVVYSFTYRDFSTMKAEFLFPGALAYAAFFAAETDRAAVRWSRWPRRRGAAVSLLVALLILYVTDIVILAVQLT